jgi:hypothetical protein
MTLSYINLTWSMKSPLILAPMILVFW